ncbi:MAG TPA: leucyl aminopeptidase [Spirochaetota bacterium]|nr:leucyl aminopeptidase [Spirochaetota bacterium]HPC40406.1 leucyl aminopeptidase [Spirochaetota bacterium]HPL18783.1 leucyl aminopeptidase [Spirochaetota bacterium]HQF06473.1 leucyl aminopeptidase [Spirochaetota bacterium]HQH98058.1 leucyl aminopeptidase [Spirochaetota bacterium]
MKLIPKQKVPSFKKSDTVVLFIGEEEAASRGKKMPGTFSHIEETIDLSFFKGKRSEIIFVPLADKPNFILCGTGNDKERDAESMRRCAAAVVSQCRDRSIERIHVLVPPMKNMDASMALSAVSEGLYLGNYSFDRYKTNKKDNGAHPVSTAVLYSSAKNASSILKDTEIVARNTLLCRDLINETSEKSDSRGIAREAASLAALAGVTCRVFGKKEIEKMKMGLILAVNKGSTRPPQLVVLTYRGNPRSRKFFAVVGKGITFDSGGMNLKPSGHIEDMRTDMAGAAAALYTIKSAAELKLKKNVYAVLPLTDNMLSNDSYRPGDVFTAYNGTTVEIGNTDAEGRLILADAIAYTEKVLKPACIVDIATLTGACLVTFGEIIAGYVTTSRDLGSLLEKAGEATGELIWELPIHKDYEENLKSDIADLCNISSEKNAGTIMGGIFLKNFVNDAQWAHIDIAGTARSSKPRGYRPKNATGFGVRLLVEAIRQWND